MDRSYGRRFGFTSARGTVWALGGLHRENPAALKASAVLKGIVTNPEIAEFLDKFIEVEKERIEAVETV